MISSRKWYFLHAFIVLPFAVFFASCSVEKNVETAASDALEAIYDNDLRAFYKTIGEDQREKASDEYVKVFLEKHHELFASKGKLSKFEIEIDPISGASVEVFARRYQEGLIFAYDPEYRFYDVIYVYPEGNFYIAVFFQDTSGNSHMLLPLIRFGDDS